MSVAVSNIHPHYIMLSIGKWLSMRFSARVYIWFKTHNITLFHTGVSSLESVVVFLNESHSITMAIYVY